MVRGLGGQLLAAFITARAAAARTGRDRRPFFLWLTPLAIHAESPGGIEDPLIQDIVDNPRAAPRHEGRLRRIPLPRPPDFNEADVSDKPQIIQRFEPLDVKTIEALTFHHRSRMEALLAVDDLVETVFAALDATGLTESTLVIFTSDNGYFLGSHRVPLGKVLVYEPSIRVPLVISGPGVPAGVTSTRLALNIDLAPTIVEAAGAQGAVRRSMDGRSLWSILRDPAGSWRTDFLIEGASLDFDAVRSERHVYTEFGNGDREFYDLVEDPFQLSSKHASSGDEDQATLAFLKSRLDALRRCSGSDC